MKGLFAPRWLIIILPTLAALGPYALPLGVGGVTVYAFRMLILVMAAFSTPLTSGSSWWFNKLAQRAMLLGVFWMLCGALSLLWTPNLSGGMADIVSIGFGFALLLVLLNVRAYESHNLQLLRLGWVVAFLVTAAVAVWELGTGQHLPSDMYSESAHYFDGSVVQSTLGRPEQYGMFLLVATPFLLWSFYQAKGPKKLIYAGMMAAAGILVLFTASRLTFIGFAVEVLLLAFIFDRRWYVMMLGLLAMAVGYVWWTSTFMSSELRIADKFTSALSDKEDGSISTRIGLTLNGLWMVYDTAGRGVGASGFIDTITEPDMPFPLPSHKAEGRLAHNLWVQIGSEYGVLPAAGIVALFVFIARLSLQAANRKWPGTSREVRTLGISMLVGLVGYLFYGVITGSPLRHSVHWMVFASLVIVAVHLYKVKVASYAARARMRQGSFANASAFPSPGRRPGEIGREADALSRSSA